MKQEYIRELISIIKVLQPYKRHETTAATIQNVIKPLDLDVLVNELIKEDRSTTTNVVQKPPNTLPIGGGKQSFHAACFETVLAEEFEQGIENPDPGSMPFAANRGGRCAYHGCRKPLFSAGDEIVIRQRMPKAGQA